MSKASILIIDDNAMNLDIAKDLLEHAGFKTLEAEDALTGIRLMKEQHPDLVLLDLLMPRLDGFEAMRIVHDDPEIKDIPLIAFTALASREDREKALEKGCKGIIVKPIDTVAFIPSVESYLEGKDSLQPVSSEKLSTYTPIESISPKISKSHSILIVDDNPMNVDILKEAVTALGQRAIPASRGEEALHLLAQHKVDLVLLDIMMPGMDGYAVLDAIKANPETADIPIIIISALDQTEDRVKGLLQGGFDYISKPFELLEVQARVSVALRMKDLQDQLKKERDELNTLNHELDHFTTIASHDMQAPLRKIVTFAEQIKKSTESQLGESDQDSLHRISVSATRLQNLIWDLLALSRARYHKRREPKPIDLSSVIKDVLNDLREEINKTEARIEISKMPIIEGDETQIRQLIYNLIANAIKFRRVGEPPVINIDAKLQDNEKIQLIFEDTGIGFNEEHAERIFKPFERLHGVSQYPGTGIGLAICQKVAERHGGWITAKSVLNEGATFTVHLPIKQKARDDAQ